MDESPQEENKQTNKDFTVELDEPIVFNKIKLLKLDLTHTWAPFGKGKMKIENDGIQLEYGPHSTLETKCKFKWYDLCELDDKKIEKGEFISNFGNSDKENYWKIKFDTYGVKRETDRLAQLFLSLPTELRGMRCASCGSHTNEDGFCEVCKVDVNESLKTRGVIKFLVGCCVIALSLLIIAKFLQDQNGFWSYFWKGVGVIGGIFPAIQGFREWMGKR
jgi:hypothetical protein